MAFRFRRAGDQAPSDTAATAVVALVYSASLAMESVLLPLLAVAEHYTRPEIGLLTALSAVTQLLFRLGSASAMRRIPDRLLVVVAALVLALAALILTWSQALGFFVVAELVQGAARGMFWTAAQSHVVRSRSKAVGRMATVNFVSSFGLLAGPPVAGVLAEGSFTVALDAAAGVGVVAAVLAACTMKRLPLFEAAAERRRSQMWSRPGVRVGCWAGVTAGSWRGLVNSYVPVVLEQASSSSALVGVMVAVANGASIAGAGLVGTLGHRGRRRAFPAGIVAAGAGIAVCGFAAHAPAGVAVALAVSGIGAGMLQTLGPTAAAGAVGREQRGDAVAIAGSFRAAALFAAPVGTAGLLDLVALPPALAVAGVLLALPTVAALRTPPEAELRRSAAAVVEQGPVPAAGAVAVESRSRPDQGPGHEAPAGAGGHAVPIAQDRAPGDGRSGRPR